MRLDRYLSMAAGLPRRQASTAVRVGRVWVNGVRETNPRHQVAATTDTVSFDGEPLGRPGHTTLMMHKPAGCISATRSRTHETVLDHVPPALTRRKLSPVGRLDKDTTGLLLLTTDGGLSHRVTHPRRKVDKAYVATLRAPLEPDAAARFAGGITLADGTRCKPATLEQVDDERVRVVLTEGRFHQVKRMLGAVGGHVTALHRERVGPLELDPGLAPGEVRPLTAAELELLHAALEGTARSVELPPVPGPFDVQAGDSQDALERVPG